MRALIKCLPLVAVLWMAGATTPAPVVGDGECDEEWFYNNYECQCPEMEGYGTCVGLGSQCYSLSYCEQRLEEEPEYDENPELLECCSAAAVCSLNSPICWFNEDDNYTYCEVDQSFIASEECVE